MWKALLIALALLLGMTACQAAQASGTSLGVEPVSVQSSHSAAGASKDPIDAPTAKVKPGANKTGGADMRETDEAGEQDAQGATVGICHRTGSKTNPYVFIHVNENAVDAHKAHGDIVNVTSADACPKTAPAVSTPGTRGESEKDKKHGGPPEGKGPGGKGNGNGSGQGDDKEDDNEN